MNISDEAGNVYRGGVVRALGYALTVGASL